MHFLLPLLLLLPVLPVQAQRVDSAFSWDRATIYEIVTDRFANGNSDNNSAYGRGLDGRGVPYDVDSTGHFLGGDWDGIVAWIDDGWFEQLGVDVLLVSAPWEQVHGWMSADGGTVQRYGYDGRWPLDFTAPELAFGTKNDFRRFVDRAHAAGLRVALDVAITAPGPLTLHDRAELGMTQSLPDYWRTWRPSGPGSDWSGLAPNTPIATSPPDSAARGTSPWWGSDWIHLEDTGFRVDAPVVNELPAFLVQKWGPEKTERERAALDAFFERTGYPRTAAYHVVKWITDWVAFSGVDGFRVYVPQALRGAWDPVVQALGTEATRHNPDFVLIDSVHRSVEPEDLLYAGPVHLLYGVETARTTPDMNWATYDDDLLAAWRLLGQFRARHAAVGSGDRIELGQDPLTVGYTLADGNVTDAAVVVHGAEPGTRFRVNVSRIWPDDTALRDVVSGSISIVSFGQIAFVPSADAEGMMLIEEVE